MLSSDEYRDFWIEDKLAQDDPTAVDDDHIKLEIDEVENNAELLRAMGMGHLVEQFNQCKEINESDLEVSTRLLSKRQADTVRKRVRVLNHTAKTRIPGRQGRGWQRKPDIRNVFRDLETSSTGTRSRSATPDSLDSITPESLTPWQPDNWSTTVNVGSVPSFEKYEGENSKDTLRRTPSAPPSCNRVDAPLDDATSHEIFARPVQYRGDVAGHSEGIELVGFNRIGTLYCPRNSRERARVHTRNVNALVDAPISFEMAFSKTEITQQEIQKDEGKHVLADQVTDLDFKDMTPILWVELCTIFDKHSIKVQRRKPVKRKRKEDGNLFGVNLSTLVMRDYQFINDTSVIPVPLIIRDLLSRLTDSVQDEGILRVAGNKQRVELLCNEIELNFYTKTDQIRSLMDKSTSHELVSVFKKILRDLPQPLLTFELIHLFYQIHGINDERDQLNALHILVLLLPIENRTTLYSLLKFLCLIVQNELSNKMNLHNVAMIIAPSLFPSRYVFSNRSVKNDLNAEIIFAATCCKLTETLIKGVDLLQTIPVDVLKQARTVSAITPNCTRRYQNQKQLKNKVKEKK